MSESKIDKKRKRLEDDYDTYSDNLIHHTLNGRNSVKDAEFLHDRALTLIDIARIYWENKQYDKARVCINGAINDIQKAIDILRETSDSKVNTSIKSYEKILRVFQGNEIIVNNSLTPNTGSESPIPNRYDDEDRTPHTPPRHNRKLRYNKISPDMRRHTRRHCSLFGCDSGSESENSQTSYSGSKVRGLNQEHGISPTGLFKR